MELAPFVVLAMLLGMTLVGIRHSKGIRSGEDFALANRGLSTWVLAGTLIATWIGTGSIFSNAEFTYERGIAGFFVPLSGLAGMLLLAAIAPRIRSLPAQTVPAILGLRFGRAAQVLGAIALIGAYLIIVSYQYRAGAAVAARLFPAVDLSFTMGERQLSYWPVVCCGFVVLYTALAGLWSVASTDVIAGLVIAVGVLSCLALTLGGFGGDSAGLPDTHLALSGGLGKIAWIGVMLPPFLLMIGDANLMQRFLAAKSPEVARRAAWIACVGLIVLESAIIALALVGKAQLETAPSNPAHVIVDVAFNLMPPLLGAILAAAIVAVILSTADSFLLACSTSAASDFRGAESSREPVTAKRHRMSVALFGVLSLGIAYTSDKFFDVALYAYTLYGVTLTPAVVAAIFFPRTSPTAVVAGMFSGLATAILWKLFVAGEAGFSALDPVLPALFANLVVLLIFQLLLPKSADPNPQLTPKP
jgi:SSS family solute:Na+ symporter